AYRRALHTDLTTGLLGLERVYAALGQTDSILPTLDSLVAAHPTEPLVRAVQLRALTMAGADARARAAFDAWVRAVPDDPQPYRDYARLLLEGGRTALADTVLQRAEAALGSPRPVAYELAQLRAQLGQWELSAASWADALAEQDFLHQAAVFALQRAPAEEREPVRAALLRPPASPAARRAAAWLALSWGDAAAGWEVLDGLTPGDSTLELWTAYAGEAEGMGAWSVATDALAAVLHARPSAAVAVRAASDALQAGRADAALALTDLPPDLPVADSVRLALLPLRVRALSQLGRPAEAERVANDAAGADTALARALQAELAWAWVQAGELARARAALAQGGVAADDEIRGWVALYEGDLARARTLLHGATQRRGADAVTALALLGRTAADSSAEAGAAFLALARGDSAGAAAHFEAAAATLGDAAPLLLGTAARVSLARGDTARAEGLWQRILATYAGSPEAAEAELAWARALRRRGDVAAAASHLEHLILTYPESALVPQARRELELARGRVPPASGTPP
ncbi:MAG TPA: hypothetical protein VFS08_01450, partial [Gemmatimonadaceae bacterium]|nr:hypothetical protein [Gemmatimonadaceae bacterium]